jgi:hypothetical protein
MVMTNASDPQSKRFGPSARAVAQRRGILIALQALFILAGFLLARDLPPSLGARAAVVAMVGLLLFSSRPAVMLKPLQERELSLHAAALELRRGAFKRFLVFEALRHIRVVQVPGGSRLLSLRLDTDDDSLLIRDMDGLPEVFAAVAGGKPDNAIIEIEEKKVDWGEPLPWALAVAGIGAVAGAVIALA